MNSLEFNKLKIYSSMFLLYMLLINKGLKASAGSYHNNMNSK